MDPLAITQLSVYFAVPEFLYRNYFQQLRRPKDALPSKYTLDQWVLKVELREHNTDVDGE